MLTWKIVGASQVSVYIYIDNNNSLIKKIYPITKRFKK